MKQIVVVVLGVALLAGCVGHVGVGLSGDEHRAYTRSDSSCDDGARSRDPACYEATRN